MRYILVLHIELSVILPVSCCTVDLFSQRLAEMNDADKECKEVLELFQSPHESTLQSIPTYSAGLRCGVTVTATLKILMFGITS